MSTLLSVAVNACVIRFRLDHSWGWLRIALATADAYFYAAAIFLVVSAAFGRGGTNRYFLIALGLIALRWTLSCLISSDTVAPLAALMAREVSRARLHALVYVLAPPTLVYVTSLTGFVIVTQIAGSGENALAGLIWSLPLFVAHVLFNAAAVLVVSEMWRRDWLTSNVPALITAALVWFVSPVMYRFDDLDVASAALLTSYSPGSHILAAYHNTFWFGRPVSLEVLPAAAAVAALVAMLLLRRPAGGSDMGLSGLPEPTARLTLVIDPENTLERDGGGADGDACWTIHQPIRAVPRGLSGRDWVRLVYAMCRPRRTGDVGEFDRRIESAGAIGDLYRRAMTLYPEWASDRLVCALALDDAGGGRVALVRLLDSLPRDRVPAGWAWLATHHGRADAVVVVSDRLLLPGEAAEGAFILLRKVAPPVTGRIATDLPAAYAAWLESAGGGDRDAG